MEPVRAVDAGLTYSVAVDAVAEPAAVRLVMPVMEMAPGPIVHAPVGVVKVPDDPEKLILPDVTVIPEDKVAAPVIETAPGPIVHAPVDVVKAPDDPEKLMAPAVAVIPAPSIKPPLVVRPPAIDCPLPDVDKMKLAALPASGSVYVLEAAGAVALMVVVFVVPITI